MRERARQERAVDDGRNDLAQSRTASGLSMLAAIYLAFSPLWVTYTGGALVSMYITAAIIFAFGLIQLFTESSLPSWIVALASIWLFISAFSFGMSGGAVWSQAITAIITFCLAVWDSAEINEYHRHHHAGAM